MTTTNSISSWCFLSALLTTALAAGCAGHDPLPKTGSRSSFSPPAAPPAGVTCTRSEPRPVLDAGRPDVLSTQFRRIHRTSAEESARLKGNILLTVFHTGCTHTSYVYRFQLFGSSRDLGDRAYWYRRASRLLRTAGGADVRDLANALRKAAVSKPPYGKSLPIGEYQRISLGMSRERRGSVVSIRYEFAL